MRILLHPLMLLAACLVLSGCWESKEPIFSGVDFYHRESRELITISDQYGPLGLHFAGAGNRYLPVYTKAEQGTPEFPFRKLRIGMVPIDRALARDSSADWFAERKHSRTILKDGNAHLMIFVMEADEVEGQAFVFGYVEGNKLSICPEVLRNGSAFHDRFKTFVQADGIPKNKKRGVANLIWYSSGVAQRQDELKCSHYAIEKRSEEELEDILQAIDRGDLLRARGGRAFRRPKAESRSLRYCNASSTRDNWEVKSKSSYYTLIPRRVQYRGTDEYPGLTFRVQNNGDVSFLFRVGLHRFLSEADIYQVIADGRKIYETRWQRSSRTIHGAANTLPESIVVQLQSARTVEFRVIQRRSSREIFQASATLDMSNFSAMQTIGMTKMTRLNRDRVAGRCRE